MVAAWYTGLTIAALLFAALLFAYADRGLRRPEGIAVIVGYLVFGAVLLAAVDAGIITTALALTAWRCSASTSLSDQNTAGAITWAFAELPTLLILLTLAVQWRRADTRDAVRHDRNAERDHDAELRAYNAYLAGLGRAP